VYPPLQFTYPGATKAQLRNVTVRCSLSSRVACLGVNGAGKSTMIKLLTGELKADEGSGEVWKHPNARVAYVAQHAFHHIESHLDKTPNEYIRWRYEHGKDKEALEKVTMILTPEEEAAIKKPMLVEIELADGTTKKEKRVFDEFTEGRREVRKRLEYEVRWEGFSEPSWVPHQQLIDSGFSKILKQVRLAR
jgi:elongation factor 3